MYNQGASIEETFCNANLNQNHLQKLNSLKKLENIR